MKKWELIELLSEFKIPEQTYSFKGDLQEGCVTIGYTEDATWHVYVVKNQSKEHLKVYLSADDAHEYFWQLIANAGDPSSVYLKSKFFKWLIYLGITFAIAFVFAGSQLLLNGYEEWEPTQSKFVGLSCLLAAGIAVWIMSTFENIILFHDRVEIYTIWGKLKETVWYGDIVNVGFSFSKTRRGPFSGGTSSFDFGFSTKAKRYGYSSFLHLNAKEMYQFLSARVTAPGFSEQTAKGKLTQKMIYFDIALNVVVFIAGVLGLVYGGYKYVNNEVQKFIIPFSLGMPFTIWGFGGIVGYLRAYIKHGKLE